MRCGECKFWEKDDEYESLGFCRRYAPRPPVVEPQEEVPGMDALWPRTKSADRCGEWD